MLLPLIVPVAKVVLEDCALLLLVALVIITKAVLKDCVLLLLVALAVVTNIVLVTVGKIVEPFVFEMAVEEPDIWTGIE